ncbi:hypothetical protein HDV02_004626 [Globomyces sp. JEL0801]|nr:hypothetical protein HDV02_004626 [Globomyces sp. JEL0801]
MTIPSNFKPIQIHNKVVHIEGQQKPVAIQIHEMTESLMVWVGSVLDGNQCVFGPLAVSMNSPYGSVPVGSTLIGVTTDNVSELIAKKLGKLRLLLNG